MTARLAVNSSAPCEAKTSSRVHRYTRAETRRIVGLRENELQYWERLHLVRPQIRWRKRFYSFGDLVALRAIRQVTDCRVPAWRLHRAVLAFEYRLGGLRRPLEHLRFIVHGRHIAVIPPGEDVPPIEPLSGQLLFSFGEALSENNVREMPVRSAHPWFEAALALDDDPRSCAEAVKLYLRVLQVEPDWVEARVNLAVAHYRLGNIDEAVRWLKEALDWDPAHPVAHFNLGCLLDERGDTDDAMDHFHSAIRSMPVHADAHFNLAALYEKTRRSDLAVEHWRAYLRLEPSEDGARYARARLAAVPGGPPPGPPSRSIRDVSRSLSPQPGVGI
jgi:tetratricopeptide (TPR) repeat protein